MNTSIRRISREIQKRKKERSRTITGFVYKMSSTHWQMGVVIFVCLEEEKQNKKDS